MEEENKVPVRLILAVILAVLLTAFILTNNRDVTVNFLLAERDLPLGLLIVVAALIGAIIVGMVMSFRNFSVNRENKNLKKTIDEKNEKIVDLEAKLALSESEMRSLRRERQDS